MYISRDILKELSVMLLPLIWNQTWENVFFAPYTAGGSFFTPDRDHLDRRSKNDTFAIYLLTCVSLHADNIFKAPY